MNDNFCPLPFIHLSTLPSGQTRLCCKAVNNHVPNGNLNDTTVEEVWNGEYYKSIRTQMLNGEYPEACTVCYKEDAAGKRSMRVKESEIWNNSDSLRLALENEKDGKLETDPVYLDLRMGNLCNLKCRTCDSVSSSQIHKETKEIETLPVFFKQKIDIANNSGSWWEKSTFTKSLERLLPTTELIWLSGGEPTLVEEGNKLIQDCIDKGHASDIILRLVVNLTNVTDQFIYNYEQFKEANFHCSIDAVGEANDYLRHPSKFDTLETNLKKITRSNSNLVCLICTVSLMNIFRLPELIDWLDDFNKTSPNRVRLNINPLNEPFLFHPNILDEETKAKITEKLLAYNTNEKNTAEIKSLLDIMNTENIQASKFRKDFRNYIDTLDKIRNQKFTDVFPELTKFYEVCND